jgi:single-stranded DNA-binding protein
MSAVLNRVTLLGQVGRHGFSMRYTPVGSACTAGTVVVTERGADGKEWSQYLPIEVWGKRAESVSELEPGTPVCLEGKLTRRKNKQEQWEMVVTAFLEDTGPFSTPSEAGNILMISAAVLDYIGQSRFIRREKQSYSLAAALAASSSAQCSTRTRSNLPTTLSSL